MRPETFYAQTAREIGRELGDRSRPVLARSAPAAIEDDDSGAGPIAERLPAFMAQLRDRQRPPDIIPDLVAGSRTILAPSHHKFSTAPDPFVIVLEADDPKRPTWVVFAARTLRLQLRRRWRFTSVCLSICATIPAPLDRPSPKAFTSARRTP